MAPLIFTARRSVRIALPGPRVWAMFGVLVLAACGGNGSTAPASAGARSTSSSGSETAPVVLKLVVPPKVAAQVRSRAASGASGASRSTNYVSASTMALNVSVTPSGGAALPTQVFPCTVSSCTAAFPAPVGNVSIALSLTDAADGSGNALSLTAATPVTIAANTTNAINLTSNPVVARASVLLGAVPSGAVNTLGGITADLPLTVQAYDADNNLIVGPGNYVDASGTPVVFSLAVSNAQAGGNGTVALNGGTTVSIPGASGITAHYDGHWLQGSTISMTATGGAVHTLSGATLTTTPHVVEYPVNGSPSAIIAAADGNLWFTETGGNALGKISVNGGGYTEYACACISPFFLAVGNDGQIWYTQFGNVVMKMTYAGVTTPVVNVGNYQVRIRLGPDGNMWISEEAGHNFGKIDSSSTYTSYGYPTGIRALAFDPTGNVWVTLYYYTTVARRTITGAALPSVTVPAVGNRSDGIIAGPDGNMWLANHQSDQIDMITLAGAVTPYNTQTGAAPYDIISHTDGKLWFTEQGTNSIGDITTGGSLTEYSGASIGASGTPTTLATGPDGNIWFTEPGANKIAKFVL